MVERFVFFLCLAVVTAFPLSSRPEEPADPPVRFGFPSNGETEWITCDEDWDMVSVRVVGPGFAAASVDFFLDGRWLCSTHSPKEPGSHFFGPTVSFSSIPSGHHVFKARAIGSGGVSAWTTEVPFVVDRIPVVTILSPKSNSDVWRPFRVKADASDDSGVARLLFGGKPMAGPPYEAEVSLGFAPDSFLEHVRPDADEPSHEAWGGPREVCVRAEDTSGLQGAGFIIVWVKRLYYPDSPRPTFDWDSFFQKAHPGVRTLSASETAYEFSPDDYSTEWSVVFSIRPDFASILLATPQMDGRLRSQGNWQPTEEEWTTIWGPAKERPVDDTPIYFKILDGKGAVLGKNCFVLSRAEPITTERFQTDQDGNIFPCGRRLDHNKSLVTEISNNPDFEGPLLLRQDNGNLPPRGLSPGEGIWPSWDCFPPLDKTKACLLQESHKKLYVRFRAKDALGRETVTQVYVLPYIKGC